MFRLPRLPFLALFFGLALVSATSSQAQTPAPGAASAAASAPDLSRFVAPPRPPRTPFLAWRANHAHMDSTEDQVRDSKTKLVWPRCLVGQRIEPRVTKCVGEATLMTLPEAQAYAAAQPGGWRVPTAEELQAILPTACPPNSDFWGGQLLRVALRGQRVLSASREVNGAGVLMPQACAEQVTAEPATTRAPVLLVTAEDSSFLAALKEQTARFNASLGVKTGPAPAPVFAPALGPTDAASANRPPLLAQQDRTVTQVKVQGSMAPTRDLPCLRADQIEAAFTPPDLHTGFLKCLAERRAEDALVMFSVAGIYARFDAQRIDDPSVRGGPQALIVSTSAGFTPQQREFFIGEVQGRWGKPETTQAFCAVLRRIGPPTYAPRYLVLHGLKAFTAANPMDNVRGAGFDADGTWKSLLDSYAHCPK